MAHFLKGKFRGFYPAGVSECVRDTFRFKKLGENKLYMEVTRRDLESLFFRYWRFDSASIKLIPAESDKPRLGGKVEVKNFFINFQTFTIG